MECASIAMCKMALLQVTEKAHLSGTDFSL